MYKNFPENTTLPQLEQQILEYWADNDVFNKSIDKNDDSKHFTFYEGPPTANGNPGIHHVISRTIKDLFCRYKTMQGFKVYRKAGWDTHGLPVEIEVEKKLGIKSKDEIKEFGVENFNKVCKESIFTYKDKWEDLTKRMGYWVNLDEAYITFNSEYIESVWWALKKFFDAEKMYKGFKILPFCPVCESSLSSHEVAQGYEDLKDPSVYVKFKITSGEFKDSDFLVWTTTPWTLPSNVALAVNPAFTYVQIETDKNESFILLKDRLSVITSEYKIIKEVSGKDLENIEYEKLFNYYSPDKKAFYVTLGNFVSAEDGTGIVHMAPAFGADDYETGLKYDLPLIQAVGRDGKFKTEVTDYAGRNFKESDADIIIHLKNSGRLYRKEMFVHSYPHCWRHHVPLMYYATDSWFIRTTTYNDRMLELNKNIHWHPEETGTGRFANWLEDNIDWTLSRDRFWGTPLPIWYYTDTDGKTKFECIGSIEELKSKAVNFDEVYKDKELDLHKPYIDMLELKSSSGQIMKRVNEVIDCWFDSGSMPFAQYHYPFENKEIFEKNFPADFIAEGVDQTRGWFYTLLAINSFIFDERPYKNVISNGHILDKNSKKMSKSVGNVVDPFEMFDKYGADLLRWYLVGTTPVGKPKSFNEDDIVELKNKLFDTLINTYKFFVIYCDLTGFDYSLNEPLNFSERKVIDRWILSRMNSVKKDYFRLMDEYDVTKAAKLIYDFTLDELSNWYIRRNRKRFRSPEDENDRLSAYQTLFEILNDLLKLMAPISPFISDNMFMLMNNCGSIHLQSFTDTEKDIDTELESEMSLAQDIVYLARSMRVKNNLKTRQPLKQLLVPVMNADQKRRLLKVKDIILEEINIKELNIIEGDSDIIVKKAKANFKSIGPKFGKDVKKVQSLIADFDAKDIAKIESEGYLVKDTFNISKDDIEILTQNIEGWIVESHKSLTIALDTKLDEELIEEGLTREFINRVQNFRKMNGFDINDKVKLYIDSGSKTFNSLHKYSERIFSETLSTELNQSKGNTEDYFETDLNGEACCIKIEKA